MTTLLQKQQKFTLMVVALINEAHNLGYAVTLGDAYRDPRVFGPIGTRQGYGESKSAHKQRLAIDLNLFRAGRYVSDTESHRQLGEWWESQGGSWGGRWDDGNHYSLAHGSIK